MRGGVTPYLKVALSKIYLRAFVDKLKYDFLSIPCLRGEGLSLSRQSPILRVLLI